MGLLAQLTAWTIKTVEPLGMLGLFLLAFVESSFFPIPPDMLLIILVLAAPQNALMIATVCTIGSVLGGICGYGIGRLGERAVLEKFFTHKKISRVHTLFGKYGAWAVFVAAFTPIPYKVFTIAAGVFYIDLKKFVIASCIGRGMRFFLLAFLLARYGSQILDFLNANEIPIAVFSVVLLLIGLFFVKRRAKPTVSGAVA